MNPKLSAAQQQTKPKQKVMIRWYYNVNSELGLVRTGKVRSEFAVRETASGIVSEEVTSVGREIGLDEGIEAVVVTSIDN